MGSKWGPMDPQESMEFFQGCLCIHRHILEVTYLEKLTFSKTILSSVHPMYFKLRIIFPPNIVPL